MNMNFAQKCTPCNICFVTLGCAKNEVDTARMEDKVIQAGFLLVEEPSQADAIVVNTCSFISEAIEESLETIFDIADLAAVKSGNIKLIVAGCMPSRFGEEIETELGEVKAFVPCSQEDDIVAILSKALAIDVPIHQNITTEKLYQRQPSHFAYLKISEGCDRFCTYCTIPYIRGRYHSFTWDEIYANAQADVLAGARELVLIAQDTGRWGIDLEPLSSLANLLEKLAITFPDIWIRVMYIQPEGVNDLLLETIKNYDNICSYLDIPFQHVNQKILKDMNRSGSFDEYMSLINHIREFVPGITLRTTLIAGFPGEREDHFAALCDFVEEAEFDYVGVFPYSREQGTKAYDLPDQVNEETRRDRAQILRDIADRISVSLVRARINQRMDILVLGFEDDNQLYGRAQCQAPDVDGVVFLSQGEPGSIISTTITETLWYEMEAQ